MKHFMTKYDSELPTLLCQVVLNFVLEVLKKSGILFHLYCVPLQVLFHEVIKRLQFAVMKSCETPDSS